MGEKYFAGFIAVSILITMIIGLQTLESFEPTHALEFADGVHAMVDTNSFDMGDISSISGEIKATFEIVNTGENTLTLANLYTSCMCTRAYLSDGTKKYEEFRMDASETFSATVPAGESALLTVVYDPSYHEEEYQETIQRIVYLSTNDRNNPQLEFELSGIMNINGQE